MGEKMAIALREKDNKYQKKLNEKDESLTELGNNYDSLKEEYQLIKQTKKKR
jgi:hypothetical protein